MRLLHLAASRSESEVETALALLAEQRTPPTADAVRDLLQPVGTIAVPTLTTPVLDFAVYDRLLLAGGQRG